MLYLDDVDFYGMHPAFHYINGCVEHAYAMKGFDCVCTCLLGGVHGSHSLHPHGCAGDYRIWCYERNNQLFVPTSNNPQQEAASHGASIQVIPSINEIAEKVRELTPQYTDVVVEEDHLHVEYDHPNIHH